MATEPLLTPLRKTIRSPLRNPTDWRFNSGVTAAQVQAIFDAQDPSGNGAWHDVSDLTTLYQENTGASATTPSDVGDVVGTILDKSGNGNHATALSLSRRPIHFVRMRQGFIILNMIQRIALIRVLILMLTPIQWRLLFVTLMTG